MINKLFHATTLDKFSTVKGEAWCLKCQHSLAKGA